MDRARCPERHGNGGRPADGDPVLPGQRLGQRPFHDVLQPAEPVPVERQLVVLRDAPELGLELGDDAEVSIDGAFGAADRFAVVQVGRALGADHVDRHFQPDRRVDAAVTALVVLVVVVAGPRSRSRGTGRLVSARG